MKKIGFIGAIDKSDLMMNTAKVLQILGYKVLVIECTNMQKLRYIVPTINPTKSYITSFEGIDFGIGYESLEDLAQNSGIVIESSKNFDDNKMTNKRENVYDYVLIDVDSKEGFENFEVYNAEKKYFLTKFDKYSLIKGISIFEGVKQPIELTKVLFAYTSNTKEEEAYLNFISSSYQINWNDYELYFRILGEDNEMFEENQRLEKIRLNKLSLGYRESISYLIQDISKLDNIGRIRKAIRD